METSLSRWRVMVAATWPLWMLAAACETAPAPPPAQQGGGGSGSGGAGAGFGSGPCYACVSTACSFAVGACQSEPSCVAYLECVQKCPVAADGDAEPVCEHACPKPEGSAATKAQQDLTECRLKGEGAKCVACGVEQTATHPALNQQCNASTKTKPCSKCLDKKCCEVAKTCAFNNSCVQLNDCTSTCGGDPSCNQACADKHSDGLADLLPLWGCVAYHCATACGGGDACVECAAKECTNTWIACNTDPVCWKLGVCVAGCDSMDLLPCVKACRDAATPEALAANDTMLLCREHSCSGVCGF